MNGRIRLGLILPIQVATDVTFSLAGYLGAHWGGWMGGMECRGALRSRGGWVRGCRYGGATGVWWVYG